MSSRPIYLVECAIESYHGSFRFPAYLRQLQEFKAVFHSDALDSSPRTLADTILRKIETDDVLIVIVTNAEKKRRHRVLRKTHWAKALLDALLARPEIKEMVPIVVVYFEPLILSAQNILAYEKSYFRCPFTESPDYALIRIPASNDEGFEEHKKHVVDAVRNGVDQIKSRRVEDLLESSDREMIGKSAAMLRVLGRIKKLGQHDYPVLISGPTGSGKELAAKAIHAESRRAGKPFIDVNCGAIPSGLAESELFGHEKGSFTGATMRRIGKFEQANGGTIFLDEIGDLPRDTQVKLLRVLQTGTFDRVGGKQIKVDVRVIAATHQDLEEMVEKGAFREDLFSRLDFGRLRVPYLSERREDIPLLAQHFLREYDKETGQQKAFARNAVKVFESLNWRRNIRELKSFIIRAANDCEDDSITAAYLRSAWEEDHPKKNEQVELGAQVPLKEIEREHIRRVLESTQGNISKAADILGIKRDTLRNKIKDS